MHGFGELKGLVEEITPQIVELRRLLHRHPEPAFEEHETTALISATLRDNGLAHELRAPSTGLWLDVGVEPVVAFRADLDALPIQEPEENLPRSLNRGWMHACGHDTHAAIATGIALVLHRLDLSHGVRFLFQPAEEANPGGAIALVADGLIDGLKGILAFHVDPALEVGKIGAKTGPITGSADAFEIVLKGPGGHTARPNCTVDLVEAAARVVNELPRAMRRSVDSRVPIVMVFGSIHGGDAPNVIPTRVVLKGTVRTLDRSVWETLSGLVDRALSTAVSESDADYTLDYRQGIPPVVNDSDVGASATSGLVHHMGEDAVVPTETSMGGEDFSNYLESVPGALLRLGAASGGGDLHSASFRVNEASIEFGIQAGAAALLGMLDQY